MIVNNPLLKQHDFPDFAAIKPKHVVPGISALIKEHKAKFLKILNNAKKYPTWENLLGPMEELDERLHQAWGWVTHLNSVIHSDELHKAYETALGKITSYSIYLSQHRELCNLVKEIVESSEYEYLTAEQQKAIEYMLRDFHLDGVDLDTGDRKEFKQLSKRLSLLQSRFSQNVLKATEAWYHLIKDKKDLSGISQHMLNVMQSNAKQRGWEGWLVTLHEPIFRVVITYADSHKLRKMIYRAYTTRATRHGFGGKKLNNDPLIKEILQLRYKLSKLLGFKNFTEVSLARKMAESPQVVTKFLNEIAKPAKKKARQEYRELCKFAKDNYKIKKLHPWDVTYYSEKLKEAEHAVDAQKLREYFPEQQVLDGLFGIVEKLYGVTFKEVAGKSVWHEDVRYVEVRDSDDQILGGIYLDLYARSHKRGGAWMDECRGRRILQDDKVQYPLAYLVCNLTKPIEKGAVALFTHDEVQVIFHELGHVLQHILTRVDCAAVAGIREVAWDSVEFASQFMENWAWQKKSLPFISKHYKTGKVLPKKDLENLIASRNFNKGLATVRQLEFGIFDMSLHWHYDPKRGLCQVRDVLEKVRKKVSVIEVPKFVATQNSFLHVFCGDYAAGYYSYKWAEVLACDAFQKFLSQGIFNRRLGQKFWDSILAVGGAVDPMQAFKDFMGREPKVEAMLKQQGLL